MTKKFNTLIVFIACLPPRILLSQAVSDSSWIHSHAIVDTCYTVHGRLQIANGTPSFRVWIVGTRRYLSVHQVETDSGFVLAMPSRLCRLLDLHTFIYANFRVCPFTKYIPGEMQMVGIESATRIVVERIVQDSTGGQTRELRRIDEAVFIKR